MLLPALIILAMLLLRLLVGEVRHPGSTHQQWLFLRNRAALIAGAVAFVLTAGAGWVVAKTGVLLWAVLIGLLVAFIADRLSKAETPTRPSGQ
ncbi:hypothetical protein OHB07_38145 [Streptomyces sp. NBC_00111]|uniref:hypothetical protein n=1 Tax=unclassified Streptomyces TaxID=2593676 RepID=UPI002E33D614|nr:hypothetical protein [Streptomyces sp. NBC_01460]